MPVIVESKTPSELKDEWRTHPDLYKQLNREFKFEYDFAATNDNHLAPSYFTKQVSALDAESWFFPSIQIRPSGFLNPPFSMFKQFMAKASEQIRLAGDMFGEGVIVCLVKADAPETEWWRKNVLNKDQTMTIHEVRMLWPRLPYCNEEGKLMGIPMFPSCLIIMRPKPWHHTRWVNWRDYVDN